MVFLWRCLLLTGIVYFLSSGTWTLWLSVPFIALLIGSLRNDIVTQIIHLGDAEKTRVDQLKKEIKKL